MDLSYKIVRLEFKVLEPAFINRKILLVKLIVLNVYHMMFVRHVKVDMKLIKLYFFFKIKENVFPRFVQ